MRVLVMGTNRVCHERLFAHGHEVVLFMPRDRIKPEDLRAGYRHVVVVDTHAAPELWVALARALHEDTPFDAVAAYNESTYRPARAVADALGLYCSVDLDLFDRVLNKPRMREILAEHAIPSCRYALARGRDAVLKAVHEIGLPCIVKPTDAEGSTGVARIDGPADIEPALRGLGREHLERGVLVEEFLVGEEVSVEAVSDGRRHHILAVTKKYADPRTFVERGHLVPAPLPARTRAEVERYVTGILDAFGFHDTASHTEVMLTAAGPRIIETHNRIGGDRIVDLVVYTTGVDLYDLCARQSVGADISALLADPVGQHAGAAVWYAAPEASPRQRLVEVAGVEKARNLPGVRILDLLRQPGARHGAVRTSFDRSALVVAVGDSGDEALGRARNAAAALEFHYVWDPTEDRYDAGAPR